ncbi:hypothetical protein FACS189437_06180 [Bacteroidia bacterium]|nr:hypothetical protein FACS189437_06180 [Bacteroidia bacterium]
MFGIIFLIFLANVLFVTTHNWEQKAARHQRVDDWRSKYAALIQNFDKQNVETFYNAICKLGDTLSRPSARTLYFEAHQFLAQRHSYYSLLIYLQYLHVKTPSASFRHRKVSDALKKIGFQNKMQETKFTRICDRLKENKNLTQAIDETNLLFRLTRREIQLDAAAIEEADRAQSQVAELLGKYLEDEKEIPLSLSPVNNNETGLFQLFEQNNFVLNKKEIDTFASERGVFRDSLIQQINETYYDEVEDMLIEDETDHYTLNKIYYEQIRK